MLTPVLSTLKFPEFILGRRSLDVGVDGTQLLPPTPEFPPFPVFKAMQ